MTEKISVITISYNSINTIEKTFQSVLLQTYRPLEYVIVDGGSTDGTIDIIEKYIPIFEEADIEVSFKSEHDNGISDAFNKGINRATGEIIGIINSDDQLSENALMHIMRVFERDIDVVCGDCMWIDKENNLQYIRKSRLELDKLKYQMVLMHPTCFVRKCSYEKYGMYNTSFKYVMDKELMSRFYRESAKFKYVPEVIAIMLAGGASDCNLMGVMREGERIAIANGVHPFVAKLVFLKNYLLVYIRNKLKKIPMIRKIISCVRT